MRPLIRLGPLLALALASPVVAPAAPADARPTVRLVVVDEVGEGDAAVVRVTLDAPSGRDVTVRLDTRAVTALAPGDYRGVHRRVTIPAGAAVARVAITTTADRLDEPHEDFGVRLSRPEGADLGRRRATVSIRDDDPLPRVRVEQATVTEPTFGHRLGFTQVKLSAPSERRVVVGLATRSGTAMGGQDFVPLHPTVVFEPGDTTGPVSVELLSDDRVEPAETMRLVVTEVRHATAARGATITILDAPGG